jgi:ABC-type thiamine transport system substrate-binding protein
MRGQCLPTQRYSFFECSKAYKAAVYTTNIFAGKWPANNVQAYLQDSYLNSVQFLSLIDTNVIVFNVTQDAASYKADRFTILFNSSTELPLKFIAVNAAQKGGRYRNRMDCK